MPRIVECSKCGDGHWEDRGCPTCIRVNGEIERGKAIEDAVRFGAGYLRVTAEGGYERIMPQDVMLKEGQKDG